MKFKCECGNVIVDQTDDLSYKAYSYPDQSMEALFAAAERLMQSPAPKTDLEGDRMMDDIVRPIGQRLMYQCPKCGRIYIQGTRGALYCFAPEDDDVPKDLFEGENQRT
jgi:hypothetical protein